MKERNLAERFSYDIENLLNMSPSEAAESDDRKLKNSQVEQKSYQQTVDLARRLISMDLSDESNIRKSLRNRLLKRIATGEVNVITKQEEKEKARPGLLLFLRRHPVFAFPSFLLIIVFSVMLLFPGKVAAAAQFFENIVRSLFVGRHTSIHQVDDNRSSDKKKQLQDDISVEPFGDSWLIKTPIGYFYGGGFRGQKADVYRFKSVEEAKEHASFIIPLQHDALPGGFLLDEVLLTSSDQAFLIYRYSDGFIIFNQYRVGEWQENLEEHETGLVSGEVTYSAVSVLTTEQFEPVTVNGKSAGWIEGYGLIWEKGGISFLLGGSNLSLEEATLIAESLKFEK